MDPILPAKDPTERKRQKNKENKQIECEVNDLINMRERVVYSMLNMMAGQSDSRSSRSLRT